MKPQSIDNFMKTVNKKASCWQWEGFVDRHGYGRSSINCKHQGAHRVSYQLFVGPIPHNKHVLHKCDNPGCVNPKHLYVGTHKDNMRDTSIRNRRHKTHCPKNHEYSKENTRIYQGRWHCRSCDRLR